MIERIFFRKDNHHFQFFYDDNIITASTSNPEKVVRIGNKIVLGKSTDDELPEDVQVVNDFLKTYIKDSTKCEILENYNYKKINFEKNNKKYSSNINKYILIDQISIEDILKFVTKINIKKVGLILNLLKDIIIIPINSNACVQCIINRYVFSHNEIYKYSNVWKLRSGKISITELNYFKKNVLPSINKEKEEVLMINKNDSSIVRAIPYSIEGCKNCFQKDNYLKSSSIKLKNEQIITNYNGFRHFDIKTTSKIFKPLVGDLAPIKKLENDQFIDRLLLPVYQTEISINPLVKGFRFHGGKGQNTIQAAFSAIGESMERYNAQQFGNEKIKSYTYREIKKKNINAINPKELILDPKYPVEYSEDLVLDWIEGVNLTKSEKIWVPANSVFFLYHSTEKAEQFLPQDTTGLASGMTDLEAILQGTLEIIERDSYTIYYREQLKSPTILQSSIKNEETRYLINRLKKNGIQAHLKLLKNDFGIYVVHCTTEDSYNEFPKYTHGAGAALNIETAISRAITECIQLRVSQIKINNHRSQFVNDLEYKPYLRWGDGCEEDVNIFLNDSNETINTKDCPNLSKGDLLVDVKKIIELLKKSNLELISVNLSRRDNPVKTIRSIIPGTQPADDTLRRISNRMFELPTFLNLPCREKLFERELFS